MSVEDFLSANATYIVTTVSTIASAFGLVQYRTGQLERRMDKIIETFELHTKDVEIKYVRQDVFRALEGRLDRIETKLDKVLDRRIE